MEAGKALRPRATALVATLLIAACTGLIAPDNFAYRPCVTDSDCPEEQTCSASQVCGLANGQLCKGPAPASACASGFCSRDELCCAEACTGACQSCLGGMCSALAKGEKGACADNHACTATGACYCPNLSFSGPPAPRVYGVGYAPDALAVADLNGDGKPDLVVADLVVGGGGNDAVDVLLNKGDGTFAVQGSYATGDGPSSVVAVDLNGDGRPDLAVANGGCASCPPAVPGNTVSVLLGNGDGSFAPQKTFATGNFPTAVAAADLNGDGKPDLAVTNSGDNTLSVLLGHGDGAFSAQVPYATGVGPAAIAVADLNDDGKPDLAVANEGCIACSPATTGDTVSVLLNGGGGAFPVQVPYGTGDAPDAVAIADFNDDGKPDLAVANNDDGTVSVLLNAGRGTFSAQTTYPVGTSASSVAAADLNGDGKADLATAGGGFVVGTTSSASVLFGLGDGTFGDATTVEYAGADAPRALIAEDLNDDGLTDLAIANSLGSTVSVVLNHGAGSFGATLQADSYATGPTPQAVAELDVDGDGRPDLAVVNYDGDSVSVLLNMGSGTFAPQVVYPTGNAPSSVAAADLNGDGKPDLAVANLLGNTLSVLLNRDGGTFGSQVVYPTGNTPSSVAAADLNGDGKPDLIVANGGANTVGVLVNRGDGTFDAQVTYATGNGPGSVTPLDVDGDRKTDLAVANGDDSTVSVLLNKGDGTFAPQVTYSTGGVPTVVAALDLNGDGKPDLVVANEGGTVSVLFNSGDGTFLMPVPHSLGRNAAPSAVIGRDLNGDSSPDLAVTDATNNVVDILLNRGDGTFGAAATYPTGVQPSSLAAIEVKGDGSVDLAVANEGEGTVWILLNTCNP